MRVETVCISHVDCHLAGSAEGFLAEVPIADCSLGAGRRPSSQRDDDVDISGADSARFRAGCAVTYFSYDLMR